jgi:uncharacterized protein (TIGR00251 family)
MSAWHRFDADRNVLCITLHVQPNARTTEIAGRHGESLKVRIAAPALEGRANTLLIEFLGKKLDVPASRVIIARGTRGRRKSVEIFAPGETAWRAIQDWDKT